MGVALQLNEWLVDWFIRLCQRYGGQTGSTVVLTYFLLAMKLGTHDQHHMWMWLTSQSADLYALGGYVGVFNYLQ